MSSHRKATPHAKLALTGKIVEVRGLKPDTHEQKYQAREYVCEDCNLVGTRRFLRLLPCGEKGVRKWNADGLPPTVRLAPPPPPLPKGLMNPFCGPPAS